MYVSVRKSIKEGREWRGGKERNFPERHNKNPITTLNNLIKCDTMDNRLCMLIASPFSFTVGILKISRKNKC